MAEAPTSVAVVGVGLIGGSIGLALHKHLAGVKVIGYDGDPKVLNRALEMSAIDEAAADLDQCVAEADFCFVACPVGASPDVARKAIEVSGKECVVSDVGSVKHSMMEADGVGNSERFIGGHPLAGAAAAGVNHARADLFEGAVWFLTPVERTSGVHYERLHRLIKDIGARPQAVDARTHDLLVATVSHLPHVLANVLVSQAAATITDTGEILPATGPSFRDMTRVAGSNPRIWTDIFMANADAIVPQIEAFSSALGDVADSIRAGDREKVDRWVEGALKNRRTLLEPQLTESPAIELRVSVPNKPGVLAEIALALGKAGVNIVDMALHPAPDWKSGAITLWVDGVEHAEKATVLVEDLGFPVVQINPTGS